MVDLNINKIINILVSFTLSDKFFPFVYIVNKNSRLSYEFILSIFESKAKFLSLKIFLPLFEQLKKNKNFIKQMKQIMESKNEELEKIATLYFEKIEKLEEKQDCFDKSFLKNWEFNYAEMAMIRCILFTFFLFTFPDILKLNKEFNQIDFSIMWKGIYQNIVSLLNTKEKNINEEFNLFFDYFNNLSSKEYIEDFKQMILFIFNLIKNTKELILKEKSLENYFNKEYYGNYITIDKAINISEKIIWAIYNNKSIKDIFILEGKKEKELKMKNIL